MTGAELTHLRLAATLGRAAPDLRLSIGRGGRLLLEVDRRVPAGRPCPVICQGAFHAAVAEAHRYPGCGGPTTLPGLGPPLGVADPEPLIVSLDLSGGAVLPGDVLEVPTGDTVVHLFATPLPIGRCRTVLGRWTAAAREGGRGLPEEGCGDEWSVGLHFDPGTDIALLCVTSRADEAGAGRARSEDLLAVLATAELMDDLVHPARSPWNQGDG